MAQATVVNPWLKCFTNCFLCIGGRLFRYDLYFHSDISIITDQHRYRTQGVELIDLAGRAVAPGYLDLQTKGMQGIQFSQLSENGELEDQRKLEIVSKMQLARGVTGWWATVPTIEVERWKPVVRALRPRSFPLGADLLGAHVEGPFLNPSEKGAHNAAFLRSPSETSISEVYGVDNLRDAIKMITLAPELPGSSTLIAQLQREHPYIKISLGYSAATYTEGLAALALGVCALSHVFNDMSPLHHTDPGLPGLMATGRCYYSVIPDGIHLHPSVFALCMRADPQKCIFITDSTELAAVPTGNHAALLNGNHAALLNGNHAALPNGNHAGNGQIIEGTNTLLGSGYTLNECVRMAAAFNRCCLAKAVRCVTENIADLMGETMRGKLELGRRADFVILDHDGKVHETWVRGVKVWSSA